MFVRVHFDRYTGPTIDGTSVPITPVEEKWNSNGSNCRRILIIYFYKSIEIEGTLMLNCFGKDVLMKHWYSIKKTNNEIIGVVNCNEIKDQMVYIYVKEAMDHQFLIESRIFCPCYPKGL